MLIPVCFHFEACFHMMIADEICVLGEHEQQLMWKATLGLLPSWQHMFNLLPPSFKLVMVKSLHKCIQKISVDLLRLSWVELSQVVSWWSSIVRAVFAEARLMILPSQTYKWILLIKWFLAAHAIPFCQNKRLLCGF